jgi:hypothetical protein
MEGWAWRFSLHSIRRDISSPCARSLCLRSASANFSAHTVFESWPAKLYGSGCHPVRCPWCFAQSSGFGQPSQWHLPLRSLSDIDRSTAANDLQPSALFSARKNPRCIPANTPPVFPGLRSRIQPHLLRLVTKAMSDRLLAIVKSRSSDRPLRS